MPEDYVHRIGGNKVGAGAAGETISFGLMM
jgi:hypothetical protein